MIKGKDAAGVIKEIDECKRIFQQAVEGSNPALVLVALARLIPQELFLVGKEENGICAELAFGTLRVYAWRELSGLQGRSKRRS
jgi:hypothetical protein